jgi:hypothetical protein
VLCGFSFCPKPIFAGVKCLYRTETSAASGLCRYGGVRRQAHAASRWSGLHSMAAPQILPGAPGYCLADMSQWIGGLDHESAA